ATPAPAPASCYAAAASLLDLARLHVLETEPLMGLRDGVAALILELAIAGPIEPLDPQPWATLPGVGHKETLGSAPVGYGRRAHNVGGRHVQSGPQLARSEYGHRRDVRASRVGVLAGNIAQGAAHRRTPEPLGGDVGADTHRG